MTPRLLVVEDEATARENLVHFLSKRGFEVHAVEDFSKAKRLLEAESHDLVLTDLRLPDGDGFDVLDLVKRRSPETEVIFITGYGAVDTAVEAMRRGAYDFLAKPLSLAEAEAVARKALEKRALTLEIQRLKGASRADDHLSRIIGVSAPVMELKRLVARIAPTETVVLIHGETGVGKELVAKAVHALSRRSTGPFVAVNCGAFNEELLESELFGHEKGAFTGAVRRKKGLFEFAAQGTLFLDEIGETSPSMQVKLLRTLQERTIRRVGGEAEVEVDVRIIAATNKDLKRESEQGRFRRDLYFRLNVVTIHPPPLADRPGDALLLARWFATRFADKIGVAVPTFSDAALVALNRYAYPGNIRELENIIERAVVMHRGAVIDVDALPPEVGGFAAPGGVEPEGMPTLEARERLYIREVLDKVGGNRSRAARILGINRASLWRKIKE